jgi:hypothetical protein
MNKRTVYFLWLLTDLCLAAGLLFWPPALLGAIVVTTIHNLWFVLARPNNPGFSLQVRFTYLALLILGQLPYCQWINWIQLLGTTALLTVDYCPLARLLSLAHWNRQQPLSWALITHTIFTPPVSGSFMQAQAGQQHPKP